MCGTDTRVRKSVEGVEYSVSPREWDQRSLSASGSVAIERVSGVWEWKSFHDKGRGK